MKPIVMTLATHYLKQCLTLAYLGKGQCAPNPAVGAIVVHNGEVLGAGYHKKAGQPHAEVYALTTAGEKARGATLYVTLEPCCHYGRTPPCTEAIIKAGIQHVVYAHEDPNPEMQGQGVAALRAAGISCKQILLEDINDFYRSYQYWLRTKKPWITAKLALSYDNKIAGTNGTAVKITGDEAMRFTHQHRLISDAILTTAATVNNDNPKLNVRLEEVALKKSVYVIDRELTLKHDLQLFQTAENIIVFHQPTLNEQQKEYKRKLILLGVSCVSIPLQGNYLNLNKILNHLGMVGFHDVWVEAGSQLFYALLEGNYAHQAYIYQSDKVLGSEARTAKHDLLRLLENLPYTTSKLGEHDTLYALDFFSNI